MYEMMTKVEEVGEEQEVVSFLLGLVDTSLDIVVLNKNFSNMFLLT
jgi:hypothetical protein